jgi:hypothetical protein
MKQSVVQLLVGLLGLFVLVWGEAKHYVESHPEVINTFQLEAKRAEPLQYYNYQVAYDPNSGKTWYYYGDGFWYDRPPSIRKRSVPEQTKKEPSNGGSVQGSVNRQATQATAYPTRY